MKKVDIFAAIIIGLIAAAIGSFILGSTSEWESLPLVSLVLDYSFLLFLILPAGAVIAIIIGGFLAKKIAIMYQLVKCLESGILNTLVDLGLLNLLMMFTGIVEGWKWAPLKAVSFTAGATNSYFWNKYWTFEKKETAPSKEEYAKLYTVTFVGLLMNVGISTFLVDIIGPQVGLGKNAWPIFAAGIATLIVFIWNFAGYKFLVFKK